MMTKQLPAFLLPLALFLCGCHAQSHAVAPANPPCAGFDMSGSDAKAVAIADEVMLAMGGRAAWDKARVLCWNFFGRRSHVWDKQTGDYRMQWGDKLVLMNLGTGKGRAFEKGVEVTDEAARAQALKDAKSAWINDSYWLIMPYKLKDSGLTLKYGGEGELADGRKADMLELVFAGVGDTPDNRYEVFVSRDKHMVERWQYFEKRGDDKPKMDTPWAGWEWHGGIQIAASRGEKREMSGIQVLDAPPANMMTP